MTYPVEKGVISDLDEQIFTMAMRRPGSPGS
jgi:hypothetical protein